MLKFEEFPNDGAAWLLKAIDGFSLAWGRSRVCRVEVLLQRLDLVSPSPRSLARLSRADVAQILGTPFDLDASGRGPAFRRVSLLVGCLPLLQVGQVFLDRSLVGRLPASQITLALPPGRSPSPRVTAAGGGLEGRRLKAFVEPLPRYQFLLPDQQSRAAGYLLYTQKDADYLIPDTAVLQAFYMPHRDMAMALTSGPWEHTASRVIEMEPLANGLATQVQPTSGEWHIVLRPTIPSSFARLLALLWFDPLARRCANTLFYQMHSALSESGPPDARQEATADAGRPTRWQYRPDLPFRAEHHLDLRLEGYWLRERTRQPGQRRTFMATRILGCTPPSYLPGIRFERANSSEPAAEEADSRTTAEPAFAGPGPTARGQRVQELAGLPTISAELDAESYSAIHVADVGEFEWTNAPSLPKLPKTRLARQAPLVLPSAEARSRVSAGANGSSGAAAGDAMADLLVARVRVGSSPGRLRMMHSAVELLHEQDRLSRYQPLPPVDVRHRLTRGSLDCWNFLNRDEAAGWVRRPTRGWKVVQDAQRSANELPLLRAALVIGLAWEGAHGTWIEIECRPHEAYRSVLVVGTSDLPDEVIHDVLQEIAARRGRDLDAALSAYVDALGLEVGTYQHHFCRRPDGPEDSVEQAFEVESLWRFLRAVRELR